MLRVNNLTGFGAAAGGLALNTTELDQNGDPATNYDFTVAFLPKQMVFLVGMAHDNTVLTPNDVVLDFGGAAISATLQSGTTAQAQGGSGDHVGVSIWFAYGFEKENRFKFTPKWYRWIDLSPVTLRNSLRRLQEAGLIRLEYRPGCAPIVTILDAS